MKKSKSIGGGLVAVLAVFMIGGSTIAASQGRTPSPEQTVVAVTTFLSLVILHWFLWRFIVPSRSRALAQFTSFFPRQARRTFFTGTVSFGYMQVALYCVELSGYLQQSHLGSHVGRLVMGLCLIGLGTAVRLRDVISALNAPRENHDTNA
jgi:hypothetical protein